MKTISIIVLIAGLGLAAIHSSFAASSTIEFAQDGYFDAIESVATAIVEVRRSGEVNSTATIDYVTIEGTAKAGVDYTPASGTLTFAPGELSKTFPVTVLDNGRLDGERTVKLRLGNPVGAMLGVILSGTLLIADNEAPLMVDRTFQPQIEGDVRTMVLQTDGRIVVGGSFDLDTNGVPRTVIVRLLPAGSRDPSFKPDSQLSNEVIALALQPDGKIFASDFQKIWRLNSDGSMDRTFATDITGSRLLALPDGKILVLGDTQPWRLNSNGSLDSLFSDGFLACGNIQAAAVQPDGKTIFGGDVCVAGKVHKGLVRFNRDGSLDTLFPLVLGIDPDKFHFGTAALLGSIVPLASSQVLISGRFDFVNGIVSPGMARLNADGSVDTGFRFSASAMELISCCYKPVLPIVQPDGKILLPYEHEFESGLLVRANADGSLDPAFRMPYGIPKAVALQPDGNILFGGYGLFRLFGDPTRVRSFAFSYDWDSNPLDRPLRLKVAKQNTELSVTVRRLGESTEAVTVDYTTRDGTAQAGSDYLSQTGTLTFGPLETAKTVTLSIMNQPLLKQERSFSLVLSNPSNGSILGVSSEATVTIVPQPVLTIRYQDPSVGGPIRLTLAPTTPGVSYSLWAWSDLAVLWQSLPIQQKTAVDDTLDFEDTTVARPAHRFYRAVREGPWSRTIAVLPRHRAAERYASRSAPKPPPTPRWNSTTPTPRTSSAASTARVCSLPERFADEATLLAAHAEVSLTPPSTELQTAVFFALPTAELGGVNQESFERIIAEGIELQALSLLNLVQRGSTEQWCQLYQRCRREPRVARGLATVLPMRHPEFMASTRRWKFLLGDLSGGESRTDLREEDRDVGV